MDTVTTTIASKVKTRRRRAAGLRHGELRAVLLGGDLMVIAAAELAAPELWAAFDANYLPTPGVPVWQVVSPLVWLLALRVCGAYELTRSSSARRLLGVAAQASLTVLSATLLAFYLMPFFVPRGSTLLSLALVAAGVVLWRACYFALVSSRYFDCRVALVGIDEAARRTGDAIVDVGSSIYTIVAFLAYEPPMTEMRGIPVVPLDTDLWKRIQGLDVDQLVIGQPRSLPPEVSNELVSCFEHGLEAVPATVIYEELTGRVLVSALEANWYADLPTRVRGFYAPMKRLADVAGAIVLGVLTTPLFAAVALAIWIDSGRPVFLRQTRVGRRGELFAMHKFRTMRQNAEPAGAIWATPNDDRVTRVGRLLRRSRVDELPQFWDVLRGKMSLVGPRPERPEFTARLAQELPLYRARSLVRPGITGWAQVQYGYASSVESNLAKLEYDLYYLRHFGLLVDLTIGLRTLGIVLGLRGH